MNSPISRAYVSIVESMGIAPAIVEIPRRVVHEEDEEAVVEVGELEEDGAGLGDETRRVAS